MSSRPVAARPSRRNRDSLTECSRSGPSRASGSPNTVAASSNETPCLTRFASAFRASHSNMVQYILNTWNSRAAGLLRGRYGRMLGGMLYRSYVPAAPLAGFVEDFWLYDDYRPGHLKERILPTGTSSSSSTCEMTSFASTIAGGPVSASASPGPSCPERTADSS